MSKIRVNRIENNSTANGGIDIDTSGHVKVDGLQMPTAGPLSGRNLIINGAMRVAQRATSVTGVADSTNENYQTLDRFGFLFNGTLEGVCTISQDTEVPANQGFSNSYKVDVTTADTTLDSNHYTGIYYFTEAQDTRNSGWNYTSASSYLTISFWVKSSKAGTYCWHARAHDGSASNYYYVFEYTLVANTWTKITHSIPGNSNLVFDDDTGAGLRLMWMLAAGSGKNDATADQWGQSTTFQATSNQLNFFDSTDNDFYLTGVQMEVGSKATPFEHESYGQTLLKCQRYFQRTIISNALVATSTIVHGNYQLLTEMRVAPDVGLEGGIEINDNSSNITQSAANINMFGTDTFKFIQLTDFVGLTQHRPCFMRFSSNQHRIKLDAEL